MPVIVNNITQAAAVAEGRLGAARGARSYVWVYVGSGVGSGVVIDGRLFFGQSGFSGEIGHCPVVADGPPCACGRRGCLEAVASTMASHAPSRRPSPKASRPRPRARAIDAAAITRRRRGRCAERAPARSGGRAPGPRHLVPAEHPQPRDDRARRALRRGRRDPARAPAGVGGAPRILPEGVAIVPSTLGERADLVGSVLMVMDQTTRSYRIVGNMS